MLERTTSVDYRESLASYAIDLPALERRIEISLSLVDRILEQVMQGFGALPRRGAEVGGLLLGEVVDEDGIAVVRVEDFERIPCDYLYGPSFILSPRDEAVLVQTLERWRTEEREQRVLGLYRSHTRKDLYLSDTDLDLFTQSFSDANSIFLLVRPFVTRACVGGVFLWDHDRIDGLRPTRTFPFSRRMLEEDQIQTQQIRGDLERISGSLAASPSSDPPLLPTRSLQGRSIVRQKVAKLQEFLDEQLQQTEVDQEGGLISAFRRNREPAPILPGAHFEPVYTPAEPLPAPSRTRERRPTTEEAKREVADRDESGAPEVGGEPGPVEISDHGPVAGVASIAETSAPAEEAPVSQPAGEEASGLIDDSPSQEPNPEEMWLRHLWQNDSDENEADSFFGPEKLQLLEKELARRRKEEDASYPIWEQDTESTEDSGSQDEAPGDAGETAPGLECEDEAVADVEESWAESEVSAARETVKDEAPRNWWDLDFDWSDANGQAASETGQRKPDADPASTAPPADRPSARSPEDEGLARLIETHDAEVFTPQPSSSSSPPFESSWEDRLSSGFDDLDFGKDPQVASGAAKSPDPADPMAIERGPGEEPAIDEDSWFREAAAQISHAYAEDSSETAEHSGPAHPQGDGTAEEEPAPTAESEAELQSILSVLRSVPPVQIVDPWPWRRRVAALGLFAALAGGVAGYYTGFHSGPWRGGLPLTGVLLPSETVKADGPGSVVNFGKLDLRAERQGSLIEIQWDGSSVLMGIAESGEITVLDGDRRRSVALTSTALTRGEFQYAAGDSGQSVQLIVTTQDGKQFKETAPIREP